MALNAFEHSEVPRKSVDSTPPFVPPEEINPKADLGQSERTMDRKEMNVDDIALLMDTGPKAGESVEDYHERMRVYRQRLAEDDHLDASYPPSGVH